MRELLSRPKVAVSIVYVAGLFMSIMDATIVNVALPNIGRDLHVGATNVDAISIGYLVSLAIVIPTSGWVGDRFGGKRVMLAAIVIFTAASVLCGLAQSFGELVAFRILQGVGGGMLTPVGMAMLFRVFPPQERVRASSILVIPTALAPAVGPVLGGLLVDSLSWRWVFFVNLPLGLLALAYGVLFLRDTDLPPAGRFDVPGFLLSGAGFAALMYGVSEGPDKGWGSTQIVVTITVGVALLLILVASQLRTREPLLNLRLFGDRLFRSATAALFLATAAFLGVLYLVALFFQVGLGMDALGSGLSTFPEAIGVMVGAQAVSRRLYPWLGPRRVMTGGLVGVGAVMVAMTQIDAGDLWAMRGLMFLLGYAMAHCFVPAQAAAFARISASDMGRGSTLFNALRQLGGAAGVAALTSVITAAGVGQTLVSGAGTRDLHPYHAAFLVAGVISLAAALICLTIRDEDAESTRVRRRRQVPTPEPALVD
ncbi:MAG TPA: MDR family MFS transporter [Mycobacteriales bacterium]